jgi:hypothetical protein
MRAPPGWQVWALAEILMVERHAVPWRCFVGVQGNNPNRLALQQRGLSRSPSGRPSLLMERDWTSVVSTAGAGQVPFAHAPQKACRDVPSGRLPCPSSRAGFYQDQPKENVMRKLIVALGAAALMSGAAWAASVDGVVKDYIKETKVITLEDGKSFTVPPDVAVPPELVVGAKVSITTAADDATKVTQVTLSPM